MARRRPALPPFTQVVPAGAPAAAEPPVAWGYARVSTDDQTTEPQAISLAAAGIAPGRIVVETISGSRMAAARNNWAVLPDVRQAKLSPNGCTLPARSTGRAAKSGR